MRGGDGTGWSPDGAPRCVSMTLLAESENVTVRRCSCGNIHLQIGAVMLTMQPDELFEIGGVVRAALQHQALCGGSPAIN